MSSRQVESVLSEGLTEFIRLPYNKPDSPLTYPRHPTEIEFTLAPSCTTTIDCLTGNLASIDPGVAAVTSSSVTNQFDSPLQDLVIGEQIARNQLMDDSIADSEGEQEFGFQDGPQIQPTGPIVTISPQETTSTDVTSIDRTINSDPIMTASKSNSSKPLTLNESTKDTIEGTTVSSLVVRLTKPVTVVPTSEDELVIVTSSKSAKTTTKSKRRKPSKQTTTKRIVGSDDETDKAFSQDQNVLAAQQANAKDDEMDDDFTEGKDVQCGRWGSKKRKERPTSNKTRGKKRKSDVMSSPQAEPAEPAETAEDSVAGIETSAAKERKSSSFQATRSSDTSKKEKATKKPASKKADIFKSKEFVIDSDIAEEEIPFSAEKPTVKEITPLPSTPMQFSRTSTKSKVKEKGKRKKVVLDDEDDLAEGEMQMIDEEVSDVASAKKSSIKRKAFSKPPSTRKRKGKADAFEVVVSQVGYTDEESKSSRKLEDDQSVAEDVLSEAVEPKEIDAKAHSQIAVLSPKRKNSKSRVERDSLTDTNEKGQRSSGSAQTQVKAATHGPDAAVVTIEPSKLHDKKVNMLKTSLSAMEKQPVKKGSLAAIIQKTGGVAWRPAGLSKKQRVPHLHQTIVPPPPKPPIPKSKRKKLDSDDDGEEFLTPAQIARRKRIALGLDSDEALPKPDIYSDEEPPKEPDYGSD